MKFDKLHCVGYPVGTVTLNGLRAFEDVVWYVCSYEYLGQIHLSFSVVRTTQEYHVMDITLQNSFARLCRQLPLIPQSICAMHRIKQGNTALAEKAINKTLAERLHLTLSCRKPRQQKLDICLQIGNAMSKRKYDLNAFQKALTPIAQEEQERSRRLATEGLTVQQALLQGLKPGDIVAMKFNTYVVTNLGSGQITLMYLAGVSPPAKPDMQFAVHRGDSHLRLLLEPAKRWQALYPRRLRHIRRRYLS